MDLDLIGRSSELRSSRDELNEWKNKVCVALIEEFCYA